MALIDLLYNNVETLEGGIQDLQKSMKGGIAVTEEMAQAINNTPEQKFQVLKQQIHNNVEELGNGLLPAVNNTMDKVSGLIKKGSEWISNNQETVQSIMNIALKLGVFLIVAGSVLGVLGTVGKTFLAVKNVIGFVKIAVMGLNSAFLASPVGWVVLGIMALVAAFVVLWNKSEAFRNFWMAVFGQVRSAVQQAWEAAKPALQNLGQKLMGLWQAAQPIVQILEKIGAVVLVSLGARFAGILQGAAAAVTPLINALSSLVSFVANVVNMVVALFRGDFSGALEYAGAAVEDLKNFFLNGLDAILSFAEGFADGFFDAIGNALSAVGIDADMTKMKETVKNRLQDIRGLFGNILGAASDTVKEKLNNMKSAYEAHGGGIRGIAAAAMEGVKGYFTAGFSFVDNLTGGKLSSVKEKIAEKLQGAENAVKAGLERIRSFFNITFPVPKIKMPHISASGSFSLKPLSVPKFSIKWNKEGGILNGATIFGAMGGNLLGGGEAGAEAVLPLAELWKQMKEIVGGIVAGENEKDGENAQKTGISITSALTQKTASLRKEKEKETSSTDTFTSERWGREGGTTIHQITFTVDISKIKDLPLLYKLIDELKDAQNRSDPTPSGT